jgi:hypothetical protein
VLEYAAHFDEPCEAQVVARSRIESSGQTKYEQTVLVKIDSDETSNAVNDDVKTQVEHGYDDDVFSPAVDLSRTGGYMTSRTRLAGITHLHECAHLCILRMNPGFTHYAILPDPKSSSSQLELQNRG